MLEETAAGLLHFKGKKSHVHFLLNIYKWSGDATFDDVAIDQDCSSKTVSRGVLRTRKYVRSM